MRTLFHPTRAQITLPAVLHAMADPVRLAILRRLAGGEELSCRGCCTIVPPATLSHHFRVLREAGVVSSRRQGTELLSRLRQEDVEARFPGLLDTVLDCAALDGATREPPAP